MWLTGRPASGKSTLAADVASALQEKGVVPVILDSDEVRSALVPALGYDEEARDQFYETLANLAALLAGQGHAVLVPATANRERYRQRARERAPAFIEVYVATSVATCAERDPKGLYARAAAGAAKDLPGAGAVYEEPSSPEVIAPVGSSPEAVAAIVYAIAAQTASE